MPRLSWSQYEERMERESSAQVPLFCRTPQPKSMAENEKRLKSRAEKDPAAMRQLGTMYVGEKDFERVYQYLSKAVNLGNVAANFELGYMYHIGEGVEKDDSKAIYHYEQAAVVGHVLARYNLGNFRVGEWSAWRGCIIGLPQRKPIGGEK